MLRRREGKLLCRLPKVHGLLRRDRPLNSTRKPASIRVSLGRFPNPLATLSSARRPLLSAISWLANRRHSLLLRSALKFRQSLAPLARHCLSEQYRLRGLEPSLVPSFGVNLGALLPVERLAEIG